MNEIYEESRAVIARLGALDESLTSLSAEAGPGIRTLLVSYGWWTRIVHTAQAIAAVHEAGLAHEASPLLRALIHHAVALKWLGEHPDEAIDAITWEHSFEGDRMLNKALDREWDLDPGAGPKPPAEKAPVGYEYLRSMEKLCDRAGMTHALVALLSESKFAHPTAISADAYLAEVNGEPSLIRHPDAYTPLHAAAMFAAESTIQFATVAGLDAIALEAGEMRDRLASLLGLGD